MSLNKHRSPFYLLPICLIQFLYPIHFSSIKIVWVRL